MMKIFWEILSWISSLRVAIILLLVIAISSAIGTAIPQGEERAYYLNIYEKQPWLGLINSKALLLLQLNNIYSSFWFLTLLAWLGLALMLCSWRRQWPILRSALKWDDFKSSAQLKNLAIARTVPMSNNNLNDIALNLQKKGWRVKQEEGRLAARKGVYGRVGPPLIHLGIILLLLGAGWGALSGQKIERFLTPEKSFELINRNGENELIITLKDFKVDRDPTGRAEQFRSQLELVNELDQSRTLQEVSVNHPIRFEGMTIYQADWAIKGLTLQVGSNSPIQLPVKNLPELGDQMWGIVLPTKNDGTSPILLSISNEKGPIRVFDENGSLLNSLRPGGSAKDVKGVELSIKSVLTASGLLLKRDPGVPLVYSGFAVTLIGGFLSIITTMKIWVIEDTKNSNWHIGCFANRDFTTLYKLLPNILDAA